MVKIAVETQLKVLFTSMMCSLQSDNCPYLLFLHFAISLGSHKASSILPALFLCITLLGKENENRRSRESLNAVIAFSINFRELLEKQNAKTVKNVFMVPTSCRKMLKSLFYHRYPWCSKCLNGWWEYLGEAGGNWLIKACFPLTCLVPLVYFAVNGLTPFFLGDFYKLVLGEIRGVTTEGASLPFFLQGLLHRYSMDFP